MYSYCRTLIWDLPKTVIIGITQYDDTMMAEVLLLTVWRWTVSMITSRLPVINWQYHSGPPRAKAGPVTVSSSGSRPRLWYRRYWHHKWSNYSQRKRFIAHRESEVAEHVWHSCRRVLILPDPRVTDPPVLPFGVTGIVIPVDEPSLTPVQWRGIRYQTKVFARSIQQH